MISAILILIILALLDVMLYFACAELEKKEKEWEKRHERSNSENDN